MSNRELRALMATMIWSSDHTAETVAGAVDMADAILKRVRDMPPEHEVTGTGGSDMPLSQDVEKWQRRKFDAERNNLKTRLEEAENQKSILKHHLKELRNSNEELQKDVGELRAVNCNQAKDKAALEDEKAALEQKLEATKTDIRRYSRAINAQWGKLNDIQDIAEDVVTRIPIDDPHHQQLNRIICIAKGKEDT